MENRERDRVSQRSTPTEAGQLNRSVEEEKGRQENSGTSAEFGQKIGRSENLSEGGEMNRNRNQEDELSNRNIGSESTRRSGQGSMGSSSGRSSGSGSMDGSGVTGNQSSSGGRNSGNSGSSGIGDSSEGRH